MRGGITNDKGKAIMGMSTKKKLENIAAHEAGHAVMHLIKGIKFAEVWIGTSRTDATGAVATRGAVDPLVGEIVRPSQDLLISMAGAAGSDLWFGKPPKKISSLRFISELQGDFEILVRNCSSLCEWYGKTIDELMDDGHVWAYNELKRYKSLHSELTRELLEVTRISYEGCRRIAAQYAGPWSRESSGAVVAA